MRFWLTAASSLAPEVDYLILVLLAVSFITLGLVFGLMALFIVRYRAGSGIDRGQVRQKTWRIETAWTVATMVAFFGLFLWGADLYVRMFKPPPGALQIYVVGKQWMWKVEHPGGQREIDTLHVPTERPVQLIMTSEDVIHDFSIPAFRLKHDVLPGRYETYWFRADKPGTYHLFCQQYCGADHSKMVGEVIAMPGPEYERWLEQAGTSNTLAQEGQVLLMRFGCTGCHGENSPVHAPSFKGLYGSPVTLNDGKHMIADDRYIRDCILLPETERVAGYPPIMPSFSGVISEEDLLKIIAYIKSLGPERTS
ncbi:MAG: cytochrome c oxidase subunit II [Acetobacteraceae bacterium]|nr:cytochrome c oxidase subunit II [Acetobacteraceae bacterium]MBV8521535.1 cytochrome c oxidase subunit II [Acetobacteraceae bacterium]MBV8590472.1 cytochrome c oxidase subunit II [Acetobacteraceae bacterium]